MVNHYVRTLLFLGILLVRTGATGQTAPAAWVVPEEAAEKVCPFQFSPETVKAGENIFQRNCKSCHGDPGKKNWAKIVPPPGDPASADFQKQTDGEMFFRITTGKAPMPQFGSILSTEERWQVISFLRSFNSGYIQPLPVVNTAAGEKNLKLYLYCNYKQKLLYVICKEVTEENKEISIKGIDIQLNARRYFGILKIGDPKTTDKLGMVLFPFPSDLPGGKWGILDLSASVSDPSGLLNSRDAHGKLAIGKPLLLKSLTTGRAMWQVRSKAPIWLILTFSLSILTVWGFIIYILLSLRKLKNIT